MRRLAGLFLIVSRSLRQHALSSCVTAFSVALGTGLIMAVFSVNTQAVRAFTGGPAGFDAVLGARGSALQLVLNTVFHLETSPGNIPWEVYTRIRSDPRVELAIPYAVGDNYYGFRIVGSTDEIFTRFHYVQGKTFEVQSGGRVFDSRRREAVVGSIAAEKTGLKVGSTFTPYHGVAFDEKKRHDDRYVVVGILRPTNSPSDRVIWIPIEGIFRMTGHVLRGEGKDYQPKPGEAIADRHKEVSAVMLKFKNPQAGFQLDQMINRQGSVATLAWPIGKVMAELFAKIGWVNRILEMIAYLVVLVAAASILAAIHNSMNERRREFAILRSLGARRRTVFALIVLESGSIAAIGSLAAFVVYGVILGAASVVVRQQTGVVLDVWELHPALILAPLGMIGLGALAGILPAVKAYSTDVASNLVPTS